ncbi:MAG: LysM peptidoglycan-binding domain-containing protein, partial [Ilumatobacteraceae bacterium]
MKRLISLRRPDPSGYKQARRSSRTTLCKAAVGLAAAALATSVGSPSASAHGSASVPSPPSAPTDLVYVVKSGDYLAGIAVGLGVKLSDLLTLNNMTVESLIIPGNPIRVPSGGTVPAATSNAQAAPPVALPVPVPTYVVRPGDYLIDIADKNGVTLKALLAANDMIASSVIVPGRQLVLPPRTLPMAPPIEPLILASMTPSVGSSTPIAAPTAGLVEPTSIDAVVSFLTAQLGKPYEFNKAGPDSYDCSGLVRAAYLQIGISLPHQSLLQSRTGSPV